MAEEAGAVRPVVEGCALVALRGRHGLTVAAAAARVRVAAGTWAWWERSGVPRGDLFYVELLCLVLDDAEGLQIIEACAASARR